MLGVSPATVRRLGDSGRLPVRRVGARRERRFRREDVERFALSGAGATSGKVEPAAERGHLGLEPPAHLATFYDTDAGRMRLSAPLLIEGLRSAEPTFLIASGNLLDKYLERLHAEPGLDLDRALAGGLLTIVSAPGSTVAAAMAWWENAFWNALEGGARRIRIVGEMVSEREVFSSEAEMLAYEAAFNLTYQRFPSVVLCQYDAREFSGETLLTALRSHPDLYRRPLGAFLN